MRTVRQVSAGGVAYRRQGGEVEIVLIAVGRQDRWQLPKGLVEGGESEDEVAVREVGEETGIETKLIRPLKTIEYWYVGDRRGERVRFHKFVHFFLMAYQSGTVEDYDRREVNEARWVKLDRAVEMLAFQNERDVVQEAAEMLQG